MMPLGDELRADDDVEAPLRDVVELRPQALDRVDEIARENQNAAAGKELRRLLLQPFDAGAHGCEAFRRMAVRARGRRRHRVAAVMADEPALEAMIDEPRVAIRAVQAIAAGAAQSERRVTAAIE